MELTESIKVVKQKALGLLSKKEYSEFKLRQKLLSAKNIDIDSAQLDQVISWLKAQGYLSDQRYKELRVRGLLRKGKSHRDIQWKCQEENITVSNEEISAVQDDLQISDKERLWPHIDKKIRTLGKELSDWDCFIKVKQSLIQKGFEVDDQLIKTLIQNIKSSY